MSRHHFRVREHVRAAQHTRAALQTLYFDQSMRLFIDGPATPDAIFDAIGLLREGVIRRGSAFKIGHFGPHRFNAVVGWLQQLGYPTDGLCIPVRRPHPDIIANNAGPSR